MSGETSEPALDLIEPFDDDDGVSESGGERGREWWRAPLSSDWRCFGCGV